jgi:hypothetical protein
MSELPSRTTTESATSRLARPILIAGLLGGLLGGMASFAASRLIKPAKPVVELTAKERATEEARHIVEAFLAMLKEGKSEKNDEFMIQVQLAHTFLPNEQFKPFKEKFDNTRKLFPQVLGPSLHEFELLKEAASSTDLVAFVYLEKYERGAVVWKFVMYRGNDQWRVAYLDYSENSHDAFTP